MDIDCYGEVESEFEKKGKGLLDLKKFLLIKFMPTLSGLLKIKMTNTESEKFFLNLCKRIVEQRENSKQEVKDVLGNLISVGRENPDMTYEMMHKTCLQFFTDGYESAAQAISVLLHHLMFHQEIIEKVQEEIDAVYENKNDDEELSEEDINNVPYLDQVLSEGWRLGMVAMTTRECTKPWKIPGDNLVIPKGMHVIIPTAGLHLDPKYWTEPTKFDPDRFSPENKGKIDSAVYQPFGIGRRSCLGQNLIRMETKVMLIELLRNFSIKPFGEVTEDRVWDKDVFIGFKSVKMNIVSRV